MKCEALQKLVEWQNGERGRRTEIFHDTAYGPTEWSVILINVNKKIQENWISDLADISHACVLGMDISWPWRLNAKFENAENTVFSEENDLENLILIAIEKAEELGL